MHQGCVRSRQRRWPRQRQGGGRRRQAVGGREAYDTRELATDHEQYLSGHGESPGRWHDATTLGLQGEASPAGFQAMFVGRHPTTGELLGRPHGRNAVPAFDVVLRPTKSVSVLSGVGDPVTGRAVLAAHHSGLAEAVAYLDEPFTAPRSPGQGGHRPGCRWVAARRLPSMLRALPPVLGPERVAWLADQARVRFHPAA